MRDELFGPVVTASSTDERTLAETLELVDDVALRADRRGLRQRPPAIEQAHDALRYARATSTSTTSRPAPSSASSRSAARALGTNDKAGSMWNLIRWVSPRAIKETFVPPTDYRYPFLAARRRTQAGGHDALHAKALATERAVAS